MADCKFCGKKAGFLRGKHKEREEINAAGRREMAALAAQAASAPHFSEASLRIGLSAIAQRSWIGEGGVQAAITQGWHDAVRASLGSKAEARLQDSQPDSGHNPIAHPTLALV